MSDTKTSLIAVQPDKAATVEMAPPPTWAITMFGNVNERLDKLVDAGIESNVRMSRLEVRVEEVEKRQRSASIRAREPSQHDLETKDALRAEKEARERLEKKFDEYAARPDGAALVIAEVKSAAKTPMGQKLLGASMTVLLAALTLLGIRMQSQVNHLESKPETVQAAPTVYVPVPTPMAIITDGGVK